MTRQLSRKRRAVADEDYDDYEEERSSRSRRPRWAEDDEEEEQERPRRASRRSRDEDDDEDERPSRGRRSSRGGKKEQKPSASVGRGWDTVKNERAKKAAGNAHRLQVRDDEVIVHFLEDEPFAVYEQHWVGQRSYTCPGKDCPLCLRGYDTRYLTLFNVVEMSSAENFFWEAGPNATKAMQEAAERKQSSPINRDDLYFALNRTKQSNGFYDFSVTPIKERDLVDDDWGVDPLTDDELDEALKNLFDDSVIPYNSARDLKSVADTDEE